MASEENILTDEGDDAISGFKNDPNSNNRGSKKTKDKKKSHIIKVVCSIILVIIILAFSFMGYIFYSQNKKLKNYNLKNISNKKTLLLVTTAISKEVGYERSNRLLQYSPMTLFDLLSNNSLFNLEVVSPYKGSGFFSPNGLLEKYGCIVIDFLDFGFGYSDEQIRAFIDYVKNGGSLLATHDQFDYIPGMLDLLGLENYCNESQFYNEVFINPEEINHPLFNNVYILNERGSIRIFQTHRNCGQFIKGKFPNARCLLSLDNEEFLVINKNGNGKTAMIRSGHSTKVSAINILSEDEKKLFVNTVYWLLYGD